MKTAQDIAKLTDELYRLEIERRQNEEKIDKLRNRIFDGMKTIGIDVIPREDYTVSLTCTPRYGKPTYDQLLEVLGSSAKKYRIVSVDPKARLELPPQVASKLFPLISTGETIRMRLRVDNGNSKE
jgi:hypothetical protein